MKRPMKEFKLFLMALLCFAVVVDSCGDEKPSDNPDIVDGKYIDFIDGYTIYFKDGSIYDMGENEAKIIYYLSRHAEKGSLPAGDPQLSVEGLMRSYRLADIFNKTKLDAIYSTPFTRTLTTVDSLASSQGLITNQYEPDDFQNLTNRISQSMGVNSVFIVGHSNTIPSLANFLLDEQVYVQSFDENDYDNLLIVIESNDRKKKLLKLKYK